MDLWTIAENINRLASFCGMRDLEDLSKESLMRTYGVGQADLLILFGGSIPYGWDAAGSAFSGNIAKYLMVVGGEGHTTETLRQKLKTSCPDLETAGKREADMMSSYLRKKFGIADCILERESTNCGNNVTYALDTIRKNGLAPETIIIMQDTTMQRRMDAGFRKYVAGTGVRIINYAAYRATVTVKEDRLAFAEDDLWGMWGMDHYISLLMGEIPRLTDDEDGYGPRGKGFIAHTDIPPEVKDAFDELKKEYGSWIRAANPEFAS